MGPVAILFSGSDRWWIKKMSAPASWVLFEAMGRITWPWVTKLYQRLYSIVMTYIYHERIYLMKRT